MLIVIITTCLLSLHGQAQLVAVLLKVRDINLE